MNPTAYAVPSPPCLIGLSAATDANLDSHCRTDPFLPTAPISGDDHTICFYSCWPPIHPGIILNSNVLHPVQKQVLLFYLPSDKCRIWPPFPLPGYVLVQVTIILASFSAVASKIVSLLPFFPSYAYYLLSCLRESFRTQIISLPPNKTKPFQWLCSVLIVQSQILSMTKMVLHCQASAHLSDFISYHFCLCSLCSCCTGCLVVFGSKFLPQGLCTFCVLSLRLFF